MKQAAVEQPGGVVTPAGEQLSVVGQGLLILSDVLGSAGQRIHANAGRSVDYEVVKRSNAILLGGNQSWSGRIFVHQEGFEFHGGIITNKKPLPREQALYRPGFDPVTGNLSRDYALVLLLPNERRDQRVLLLYSIYTQGMQAAIEFVTNPERLTALRRSLMEPAADKKSLQKYFQALLTTTVENYVPDKVSLVSTRAIPE
ncbi:MAG: hypothetical protein ABSC08_10990 [Bryobacteraceae bacterium]